MAALVATPTRAAAQSGDNAPLRLTLDEALARATETSHRLGEARARQAGAEATVVVRSTGDHPSATAQAGSTRTNHVDEFGI
ncbi:MAG: hypothetical protein IT181_19330, partial [Acidobacteria bacterium]|nr:hypothetical protein [Acidobacteriota bacterium]